MFSDSQKQAASFKALYLKEIEAERIIEAAAAATVVMVIAVAIIRKTKEILLLFGLVIIVNVLVRMTTIYCAEGLMREAMGGTSFSY